MSVSRVFHDETVSKHGRIAQKRTQYPEFHTHSAALDAGISVYPQSPDTRPIGNIPPRPYETHLDGSSFQDGATIPPSRPHETRSCARNRSAATHSILRAHQIHGPHTRAAKRLSLRMRIKWLGDADHLWNSRCKPQTVTRRIASITMALLIFDLPRTRSGNTIGTSTIVPPAAATRRVMSIWNT